MNRGKLLPAIASAALFASGTAFAADGTSGVQSLLQQAADIMQGAGPAIFTISIGFACIKMAFGTPITELGRPVFAGMLFGVLTWVVGTLMGIS